MADQNLEILVDVDIGSAIANLSELNRKLSSVAREIEQVDAIGSDGINIRTAIEPIEDNLVILQAKIEEFETANEITIPVGFDRSGLDRLENQIKDLSAKSARPRIEPTLRSGKIDSIKEKLSDITADVGFEGISDKELSVRSMRVAAGNVTVVGGAESGNIVDEIENVLSGFDTQTQVEGGGGGGTDDDTTVVTRRPRDISSIVDRISGIESDVTVERVTADLEPEVFEGANLGDVVDMEDIEAPNMGELMDLQTGETQRGRGGVLSSIRDMFDGLENPMKKFDLRMSDLHNALAKLVPLILVLVGAVPALYTAMIGLAAAAISAAAALLAIGGFGALGVGLQGGEFNMQRLSDVLSDIRDEFIEAFGPLSERLEPLFMDAVGGLSLLFDAVALNGDALMQLTDDARAFGQFLLSFIPSALASMAAMVETMRPVFSMMADAIDNASILRTLTALTLDIIPAVAALTSAVIDILPALVRFSAGFASILGGILTAIDFIGKLVSILPLKAEALGAVTAAALTLASAFAILNGTIFSTAVTMLLKLGAAIQTQIVQLLGYKAATTSATIATYGLTNALRALLAVTGVGLVLVGLSLAVSSVGSVFNSTESDIRSTTDALKEFDRVAGRTSGAFNPYGGDAPVSGSRAAGGGGQNVAVIEPSGNPQEQSSDVKNANWTMGRRTEQGGI